MSNKIIGALNDFIGLIYPDVCSGCGNILLKHEKYICTKCLFDIPKTKFHDDDENVVNKLFWGKTRIEAATAYCYFHKEGILQQLLHQLKYKGKKEVGYLLGKYLGAELLESVKFSTIDKVIPIPLHPKRLKKRGYNQSEWIGNGIIEIMNLEIDNISVIRDTYTETQTNKNREQRWDNVKSIYKVCDENALKGKHILLVDDVITTGATIEACAQTILQIPDVKVSIAALAVAHN